MAQMNETTLQRRLAELEAFVRGVGGANGGTVAAVRGFPTVTGSEGDVVFDTLNNMMYIYTDGEWIATGDFTWTKYAHNVVFNADNTFSVIGFQNSPDINTQWIGKAYKKKSNVESNDPNEYIWSASITDFSGLAGLADAPGTPSVYPIVEELYRTNNTSGVKARVKLSWSMNTDANFGATISFMVEYKPATQSYCSTNQAWTSKTECETNSDLVETPSPWITTGTTSSDWEVFASTTNFFAVLSDLEPDSYDFRVFAIGQFGVKSEPVFISHTVGGLSIPPLHPQRASLNSSSSNTLLTWDKSTELDVLQGGSVQIRVHSSTDGLAATWNSAQILVEALQGGTTSKTVPLLIGTYMIKFIDSSGIPSLIAAVVSNSFAASNFNFVYSSEEGPYWTGTKVNCYVHPETGNLILNASEDTMTYNFAAVLDLAPPGHVEGTPFYKNVKITPRFDASIAFESDYVCNDDDIEDFQSICAPEQDAIITFEIRSTNDNPNDVGATWSDWESLISGNFAHRGFEFRLSANTAGVANTRISFVELGVLVDTVDVIQTGTIETDFATFNNDGSLYDAGVHVNHTYDVPFYTGMSDEAHPRLGTQIIGGQEGDTVVIYSSSSTSFSLSVFNNGFRQQRDVDWQAIGQ